MQDPDVPRCGFDTCEHVGGFSFPLPRNEKRGTLPVIQVLVQTREYENIIKKKIKQRVWCCSWDNNQ